MLANTICYLQNITNKTKERIWENKRISSAMHQNNNKIPIVHISWIRNIIENKRHTQKKIQCKRTHEQKILAEAENGSDSVLYKQTETNNTFHQIINWSHQSNFIRNIVWVAQIVFFSSVFRTVRSDSSSAAKLSGVDCGCGGV